MSGIIAMFNLDGRPEDPRAVGRMLDSMRHRGPDGQASFVSGPVALGHARLCTTAESTREHQPLRDEDAQLAMVFDGRVDNRAELKDALSRSGMPPRDDSDAELVLRAYECWGEESPGRILGDFAYVIWDGRRRRLFCARDPLGVKPLYYHLDAKRFVCASELQAMLLEPEFSFEPNEGMAAEIMCGRVLDPEETLYQGILHVVPGNYLVVDSEKVRKRRYWSLNSASEIRYSDDQQYASHFFDLFKEAVRCRMRHPGTGVAAQLSGGLDSSSVVSMAAFLKREGAVDSTPFETFSLISPEPKDNERSYIDAVASKWQLRATLLGPRQFSVLNSVEQVRRFNDLPEFPNDTAMTSLYQDIADKQFRVMLTGLGGDELFYGSHEYYADAVRGLRVGSIVRRYRDDRRLKALNPDTFGAWKKLFRFGVAPVIPGSLKRTVKTLGGITSYPSWLEPDFVRRTSLVDRLRGAYWRERCEPETSEARDALPLGSSFALGKIEQLGSRYGIEVRHPLDDRRLVEFASAIPDEQRRNGIWQRYVMRQAMSDLLPAAVHRRLDKATFDWSFSAAILDEEFGRVLASPGIATAGWINDRKLGAELEAFRAGHGLHRPQVFATGAVELWHREMFANERSQSDRAMVCA
jgi:asparagine synthase (glutamine-hydrolysing)